MMLACKSILSKIVYLFALYVAQTCQMYGILNNDGRSLRGSLVWIKMVNETAY